MRPLSKIQHTIKYFCFLFISFAFFIQEASSQVQPSEELLNSISVNSLKSNLYYLASPQLKGRGNRSPELRAAASYIEAHFIESGLKRTIPGLKQTFYIKKDSVLPKPLKIGDKVYKFAKDYYTTWPQRRKKITAQSVVFASNDIKNWTFSNNTLKGKAIVIIPGMDRSDDTTRQHLKECINFAKKEGAKLVLIPSLQFFELQNLKGLDAYHSYFRHNAGWEQSGIPVIYTSWVIVQDMMDAESFSKLLKNPYAKEFEGLELRKEVTIQYNHSDIAKALENIVGYIPGKDTSDMIVIGAHYDHLGKEGRKIYFGANDNASGTAALMELANTFGRAFKEGFQPQRSIVFVAFSGEELGLYGSIDFTATKQGLVKKISAMINMDMLGRRDHNRRKPKDYVFVMGNDIFSKDWNEILKNVEQVLPDIQPDFTYNRNNDPELLLQRSDQYYFLKNGIPSLFFHDGVHKDYHSPTDTPDKIDFELLKKRTQFIFLTAWDVAFRKEKLSTDPSM